MKAITIHQPFAHLIVTPQAELPIGAVQKRIENRSKPTRHRGSLLIHAGVSLQWINLKASGSRAWVPERFTESLRLRRSDFPEFAFGAIVGVVDLVDCLRVDEIEAGSFDGRSDLGWVRNHFHTFGPFCWVLDNARKLVEPIPYRGRQGMFVVPDNMLSGCQFEE